MKTTKKHFEIFKKECQKWIKAFGMLGWRFYFDHEDLKRNWIACCYFPEELEDRVFTLALNKKIPDSVTIEDVKRSAFHEVMEAFTHRICCLGVSRYIGPDEISEEKHNIIRTLECVVFDRSKPC